MYKLPASVRSSTAPASVASPPKYPIGTALLSDQLGALQNQLLTQYSAERVQKEAEVKIMWTPQPPQNGVRTLMANGFGHPSRGQRVRQQRGDTNQPTLSSGYQNVEVTQEFSLGSATTYDDEWMKRANTVGDAVERLGLGLRMESESSAGTSSIGSLENHVLNALNEREACTGSFDASVMHENNKASCADEMRKSTSTEARTSRADGKTRPHVNSPRAAKGGATSATLTTTHNNFTRSEKASPKSASSIAHHSLKSEQKRSSSQPRSPQKQAALEPLDTLLEAVQLKLEELSHYDDELDVAPCRHTKIDSSSSITIADDKQTER